MPIDGMRVEGRTGRRGRPDHGARRIDISSADDLAPRSTGLPTEESVVLDLSAVASWIPAAWPLFCGKRCAGAMQAVVADSATVTVGPACWCSVVSNTCSNPSDQPSG